MKKMSAACLVAIGALVASAPVDEAAAGPRGASAEVTADSFSRHAAAFGASLKPAQRTALLKAAEGWRSLADNPEAFVRQVEKDVRRILPAPQARQFLALTEPAVASGGVYRPIGCFSTSKVAVIYGLVGYVGCPSDISASAAYDAYRASAYATTCMFDSVEVCSGAVTAAAASYIGWSQLLASCDVADSASYASAATYALCGGTW